MGVPHPAACSMLTHPTACRAMLPHTPRCLLSIAHTPGCLPKHGNASPPHTRLSARCNVFPTLDTASPTPSIASLHTSPHTRLLTQQCFPHTLARCLVRVMPGLSARASLSVICSSNAMHCMLDYTDVMSCKICFLLRDCTAQRSGIRLPGIIL